MTHTEVPPAPPPHRSLSSRSLKGLDCSEGDLSFTEHLLQASGRAGGARRHGLISGCGHGPWAEDRLQRFLAGETEAQLPGDVATRAQT